MTYRIVLGTSIIAAAVLTFFVFFDSSFLWWAMGEGSYYYGDASTPLLLVALAWGVVAVSVAVHRLGNTVLAAVILMPIILPAVLHGVILLILMFGGLSWR